MAIPDWMKQQPASAPPGSGRQAATGSRREKFLDRTLAHIISFTEDTMFNEIYASKKGFLQSIEPRLKVLTIVLALIALSLQKNIFTAALFSLFPLALVFISGIPLLLLLKRILPAISLTLLISLPATLNIIVSGEPILRLFSLGRPYGIGGIEIPREIFITKQGISSCLMLLTRVTASVSLVFLLTLTTRPNRFIKAVSFFIPGLFKSVISISYRYIFFLIRKVEQFIMGFRSRNISPVSGRAAARKWIALRMSLLFSISLKLSSQLEHAMESRGYRGELKAEDAKLIISKADILWIILNSVFMGAIIWRSLT